MAQVKDWISAFRLKTLPLAVSSIIAGSSLAIFQNEAFSTSQKAPIIFTMALITAILLQILSNLANDYGDYVKGTDNEERIGPARTMQSGKISKKEMFTALVICSFLILVSGLFLVYYSFSFIDPKAWIYIGIGLTSIAAAINYTVGKSAYGYKALGDIFVFIFFGIVGVIGPYYLMLHSISMESIFLAISFGLFSVMVLNLNNMRDVVNDKNSNKTTIPVLMGYDNARHFYHPSLAIIGWFSLILFFIKMDVDSLLLLFAASPLFIKNLKFTLYNTEPKNFDPQLKKIALGTFLLSLLICIGLFLNMQFPEF